MPHSRKTSTRQYTTKKEICQIVRLLLLASFLGSSLGGVLWLENAHLRGVTQGPELPRLSLADVPPLGVNLFLDREPDEAVIRRTLELARDLGAHWIKQQFPWDQIEPAARGDFWDERYQQSTWEQYDRIVRLCQEYGLELIVRLDRPPEWAREQALASSALQAALAEDPTRDITGPPDDLQDYGNYVYSVVSRYRGQIRAVQLWNEPNLANEWNWDSIDPLHFVELLRIGYTRAKEADPDIVVLFPSLAPNDGGDPRHMSDLVFLDAVYQAGGEAYFDVMSAQLYGLGQPPTEHAPLGFDRERLRLLTRTDVSRVVLLREIMERYGDEETAVWVGELGWNAVPPDWAGRPSPWGPSVSEEVKGRYIVQALDRSLREWPWMGVRNLWFLRWGGPPPHSDDPTPFFALVSYDFTPLPAYEAVQAWAADSPPLGVGYHGLGGGSVARTFLGTRLDLVLPAGADPAVVQVEIDGEIRSLQFWRREGEEARYIAADRLSDERHHLSVTAPEGVLTACYVVREIPSSWLFPLLTGTLSLGLIAVLVLLVLRLPAGLRDLWQGAWRAIERFRALPEPRQAAVVLGGTALAVGALYWPAWLPLSTVALLALALLALLRLDLALLTAVAVIPLYAQPVDLAGRHFSPFELSVLACTAAGGLELLRRLWPAEAGRTTQEAQTLRRHLPLILPAVAFLTLCAGSLLWSTDRGFLTDEGVGLLHISLREFRVTVLEPLLLYPLLLLALRGRPAGNWRVADALVLSGALVGLGGIVQVFVPSLHAEVADGVRRASSVYGIFSANALALFLGRVLPLALAGGLFLPRSRRRWLYLAALLPLGGAFFLTYSRGGYLALAVVLLLFGLLHSRVLLWLELAGAAGAALLAWLSGAIDRLLALDTFANRLTMWRNAWPLVRENLWLGLGLDGFYHHYHRRYPHLEEAYWTPHNAVLEFWTRIGLLGLAAAGWLYGTFFAAASRLYRRLRGQTEQVLILGLLGSVVYALGHGMLDGTFFAPDWAALFWIAYGLVAVLRAE